MSQKMRVLAGLAVLAWLIGSAGLVAAADGKALFVDSKCNLCHSVDSQEIAKINAKMKGPDLSKIATEIESEAWLKSFLKKEAEHDGKKHMKEFSGTDEELDVLVKWIMTLK